MGAKIEAQALALAQSADGLQKRLLLACVRAVSRRWWPHWFTIWRCASRRPTRFSGPGRSSRCRSMSAWT